MMGSNQVGKSKTSRECTRRSAGSSSTRGPSTSNDSNPEERLSGKKRTLTERPQEYALPQRPRALHVPMKDPVFHGRPSAFSSVCASAPSVARITRAVPNRTATPLAVSLDGSMTGTSLHGGPSAFSRVRAAVPLAAHVTNSAAPSAASPDRTSARITRASSLLDRSAAPSAASQDGITAPLTACVIRAATQRTANPLAVFLDGIAAPSTARTSHSDRAVLPSAASLESAVSPLTVQVAPSAATLDSVSAPSAARFTHAFSSDGPSRSVSPQHLSNFMTPSRSKSPHCPSTPTYDYPQSVSPCSPMISQKSV